MLSQDEPSENGNDSRRGSRPGLRVVARGANGQPRTYRRAPSSEQNTAYRRLALAILCLDVATLADELRRARSSASGHIVSASSASRGLIPLSAATADARSA